MICDNIDDNYFELLYVYIKKAKCLVDVSFSFTSEFNFDYDNKTKRLIIEKNDNKLKDFYNNKINSINLVVGENGAGKTTLFDLLGLRAGERKFHFDVVNNTKWFAIFKTKESKFYVEGSCKDLFIKEHSLSNTFSMFITYDFNKKEIIDFNSIDNDLNDYPFMFYFRENKNYKLLHKISGNRIENYYPILKREQIEVNKFSDLYFLGTNNYSFAKSILKKDLCIHINIKNLEIKDERLNEILVQILNNVDKASVSKNEAMQIIFLKSAIYEVFYNDVELAELHPEFYNSISQIKYKDNVQNTLLEIFKSSCICVNAFFEYSMEYFEYVKSIFNALKSIDEKDIILSPLYNSDDVSPLGTKTISLKSRMIDSLNENFMNLLKQYDKEEMFKSDFSRFFDVYLDNISLGELKLIETYASIYYAITSTYINQKSAIIILDEPDTSFHPKWITSFISNLIELIHSIDNDVKYQIIISTHSPFIISDVPKEYINCIEVKDDKRIVTKPTKSFASNFYTLIKDSFFLDSPLGEFATKKVNEIIQDINNLDNNIVHQDNINMIHAIRNKISIIDDDYLKNVLNDQLNVKISTCNKKYALLLEKEEMKRKIEDIDKQLEVLND